jgi:signal transduction histidine kinase
MTYSITKHPPRSGIRYNTTAELAERIGTSYRHVVKTPENGHSTSTSPSPGANKLYDPIKQSLVQVKWLLDKAEHLPSEKAYFYLSEVQARLKEVSGQMYELSFGQYPSILDQLGLLPVLLWYFEFYTAKTNILVNFKYHDLMRDFTSEISSTAYHIVKGVLENNSGNTTEGEIEVKIWVEKELLNIWIGNYHMSSAPATASVASANMKSLEEQVRVLGGKLIIDSSSGPATRLTVELPLLEH